MNNFETIFTFYDTVGRSPAYYGITALGTLLLSTGLISVIVRFGNRRRFFNLYVYNDSNRWNSHILLFVIGGILAIFAQAMPGVPKRLDQIYRTKQYEVTEGAVHVLHAQPANGHDKGDIIRIGSNEFHIQYYQATNAYRDTIAHGGVLTEGAYARLFWFYDGEKKVILRVDIDRSRSERLPLPKEATDHANCGCGNNKNR